MIFRSGAPGLLRKFVCTNMDESAIMIQNHGRKFLKAGVKADDFKKQIKEKSCADTFNIR